jgi:hypothetical protein
MFLIFPIDYDYERKLIVYEKAEMDLDKYILEKTN